MATGEHISIACPSCRQKFSSGVERPGGSITCPGCHKKFRVDRPLTPEDSEAAAEAVADTVLLAEPPDGAPQASPGAEDNLPAAPVAEEERIDFIEVAPADQRPSRTGQMVDPDGPAVVRVVQTMIREGLQLGASRILVLPLRERLKVVYRIEDAVAVGQECAIEMLYPVMVRLMTMTNLSGFIKVVVGRREKKLHTSFKQAREGLSAIIEIGHDSSVRELCRARAAKLGYRFVDVHKSEIPAQVLNMVPEQVVRENRILPVGVDGEVVTVAICDPQAQELLDRVRFLLNRPIAAVMAPQGAILAAIDRYYGPADPEAADLFLWELAQVPEHATEGRATEEVEPDGPSDDVAVEPLLAHLRTLCRDKMFQLFEELRRSATLCRRGDPQQSPEAGHRPRAPGHDAHGGKVQPPPPEAADLEVVFPHSHVMTLLPAEARAYIEDKVWVLREAILTRLEYFLERDHVARGAAMTYGLYAACRRLAAGEAVSINPTTATDASINFLYTLAVQLFPAIQSNGALLRLLQEQPDELSGQIADLLANPDYVADPAAARAWLARLQRQTTTDEPVDFDSPPIVHLLELLVAEAGHIGASRILLLPHEDRIEVAHRVQTEVYRRKDLPLRLLYPLLARVRMLAGPSGELSLAAEEEGRDLRATFHCTDQGVAVVIEIVPDREAIQQRRAQAESLGFPFVDLDDIQVPPALIKRIPKGIAWKKRVLPLSLEDDATLVVALGTPPTPRRLDELRLVFNRPVSVRVAPEAEIRAAIYRHYHPADARHQASPPAAGLLGR